MLKLIKITLLIKISFLLPGFLMAEHIEITPFQAKVIMSEGRLNFVAINNYWKKQKGQELVNSDEEPEKELKEEQSEAEITSATQTQKERFSELKSNYQSEVTNFKNELEIEIAKKYLSDKANEILTNKFQLNPDNFSSDLELVENIDPEAIKSYSLTRVEYSLFLESIDQLCKFTKKSLIDKKLYHLIASQLYKKTLDTEEISDWTRTALNKLFTYHLLQLTEINSHSLTKLTPKPSFGNFLFSDIPSYREKELSKRNAQKKSLLDEKNHIQTSPFGSLECYEKTGK